MENRERMLRSQNMQEIEAAKAAAFYGNDAQMQVPSSGWSPSQLIAVNNLHQYMPYGIRNDEIFQPSTAVTTSDMAAGEFASQAGFPTHLEVLPEWAAASYEFQQQQLEDRQDFNLGEGHMQNMYPINPGVVGDDTGTQFAYIQPSLHRSTLPEPPDTVAETEPVYHDHLAGMLNLQQQAGIYPANGKLRDACSFAPGNISDMRLTGLEGWYQPQIRSFDSTVDLEGNQIMSVEDCGSPVGSQALEMTLDEMNAWKYRADSYASLDRSLAPPSNGSFENPVPPAEFAVDPFRLVSDDSG